MHDYRITAITYYTGAVLMSITLCLALVVSLSWPILVEIPLAMSIFIQLVSISRSVFDLMDKTEAETVQEVYSRLKGGVFDPEPQKRSSMAEH